MFKLFLFLTIVSFNQIATQSKKDNQSNCSTEKYQQFDFWVGHWKVYNSDGKMILKSEVEQGKKEKYYNQIAWTQNYDPSAIQLQKVFKANGAIAQEVFIKK